jgi:UDP-3-O-acyl N-acetylglucosamine deacetylase
VRKQGHRSQRTIARPATIRGVGYLTGADVNLRFVPAPVDTGAVFLRVDLPARPAVPAQVAQVIGTDRRTTIAAGAAQVSLVEHVLAALAGLRIDNCFIEVDAPEPPGLDGSARAFVDALHTAGSVIQNATRNIWGVEHPIVVRAKGATLAIHPLDELKISYLLDYGRTSTVSPIAWQIHTQVLTPESFQNELASCRTFLLEQEAIDLQRQGIGPRTGTSDLLVFGPRGPIDNTLRFANEPARHKCLDIVGDLALLGCDLRGHVVAYRSGHALSVELVRTLVDRIRATEQPPRSRAA